MVVIFVDCLLGFRERGIQFPAGKQFLLDDRITYRRHRHANLGAEAVPLVSQRSDGETIFRLGGSDSGGLAPWTVIWSISEA